MPVWPGFAKARKLMKGLAGEDVMRRAVIVSTARTPIGRAYRGAFNDTQAQALAGHAIAEAVRARRGRSRPRSTT